MSWYFRIFRSIHFGGAVTCKSSCLCKKKNDSPFTHVRCNLLWWCFILSSASAVIVIVYKVTLLGLAWPQWNAFIKCWHFFVTQYMLWMEFYNWRCYYYLRKYPLSCECLCTVCKSYSIFHCTHARNSMIDAMGSLDHHHQHSSLYHCRLLPSFVSLWTAFKYCICRVRSQGKIQRISKFESKMWNFWLYSWSWLISGDRNRSEAKLFEGRSLRKRIICICTKKDNIIQIIG